MKLIQTHSEGGDCTAPYDVEDYHEIVADFVGEVLGFKGEWGFVHVDCYRYEYRYGELINAIPAEILSKRIKSVKASGGWSRMDYHIKTTQPTVIKFT